MTMTQQRLTQELHLWNDRRYFNGAMWTCTALSVGAFCALSAVRSPAAKLALSIATLGTAAAGLHCRERHYQADRRVRNWEYADLGGHAQVAVREMQPIDARSRREEEAITETENENEEDPVLKRIMAIEDKTGRKLLLSLVSFGIEAELQGIQRGLAFDRYLLRPGAGVSVAAIEKLSKDLIVSVGIESAPIIQAVSGAIAVDIPKVDRGFANYADYIHTAPEGEAWMPIGVNQLAGELVGIDFADSNCPHLLIGGTTGSGKSELLRSAVRCLSDNPSVKLGLIDIKRSTWEDFDLPVEHNGVNAIAKLFKLVRHMEDRRKVRSKVGAKDIATYNLTASEPLPRIIYFVEELKDLIDSLKFASQNELEEVNQLIGEIFDSQTSIGDGKGQIKPQVALLMAIARIGQAGRSEGIHLVITTQEPDKKLLDDLISNLPVKVALRMRSHVESNLVQCPGAEKLMGKGDLLLNVPGRSIDRLQSLYCG